MGRTLEMLRAAESQREQVRATRRESDEKLRAPKARPFGLTSLSGSRRGKKDVLVRPSTTLGRGPTNDIVFSYEEFPTVSSRHLEIRVEDTELVLHDCGSLNGTWIGDERVERRVLAHGDVISLGRQGPRLRFTLEEAGATESMDSRHGVAGGPMATPLESQEVIVSVSRRRVWPRLFLGLVALAGAASLAAVLL